MRAEPPVKWLDEMITLAVQSRLYTALDPRLAQLDSLDSLERIEGIDRRVTTLAGSEEQYNEYFSTREGADNYVWFIRGLDSLGRSVIDEQGWTLLRDLRRELRPGFEHGDALRFLEDRGVDLGRFDLTGG